MNNVLCGIQLKAPRINPKNSKLTGDESLFLKNFTPSQSLSERRLLALYSLHY
jgi:hypothetical protein